APPASMPAMPSWERGASSIPRLRPSANEPASGPVFGAGAPRTGAPAPSPATPAIPDATRDFPMDDAEERARVAAAVAAQQREEAAIAARPHQVVTPQEFDIPAAAAPWWLEM